MSRREKEKKDSLDVLGRIARATSGPMPAAKTPPAAAPARAPAPPKPQPKPEPSPPDAARAKRLKERREKLAEEKALKDRRANELARGSRLEWRGGGFTDIPASIRRTGFDRNEPTVSQKIQDVLGDAREKEGRAKAKAKGKRVGGR